MIRILALLLAGILLLLSQCGGKKEHLYTEKQVLRQLEETYGEEFAILRREELNNESQGSRYVRQGVVYTMAPLEDTDLMFEVQDLVGTALGSPIPELFPDEFHVFAVYYVDMVLNRELEALCREEDIRRLDDTWYRLELSEEGWEEQAEALADFFESCNGRHPYDCGAPMNSWLTLTVGSEDGNRWGGGFYDRDEGRYRLELEEVIQELGREAEPVPEQVQKPEGPPMEYHYGDQIILDGDEVIVVNRAQEPEEKTVPFEGTIEDEERYRGTAVLGKMAERLEGRIERAADRG